MAGDKFEIYVYAHWKGIPDPKLMGKLSAHYGKGKKAFSFEYDEDWITSREQLLIDPDIQFFEGPQYPNNKPNFGVFLDSMPDTWGKTLLKRREAQRAKEAEEKPRTLYEVDFLLGVFDESRMGGLRFKTEIDGPFLDDDDFNPTPPWSSVRELQEAAKNFESDDSNIEIRKWLAILMAPGSSLGGARPKANILDEYGNLWIAKFPSKNDTIDKGAWEFLAYELAIKAGIEMAPSKMDKVTGRFHTFFTKRFDREREERIHFSSAMTMTGNNEDILKDSPASYLDIAEFIQTHGTDVEINLHQLWRRMVFNIAVSNTDDHLRNHGFLLRDRGWVLSPAYDINPSIDKDGLALNIDMDNNTLDLDLAKSVGEYFRLDKQQMDNIVEEVIQSVQQWKIIADEAGISRGEQELMAGAFLIR
jgi:serine/threonine-protein kinase HipA